MRLRCKGQTPCHVVPTQCPCRGGPVTAGTVGLECVLMARLWPKEDRSGFSPLDEMIGLAAAVADGLVPCI